MKNINKIVIIAALFLGINGCTNDILEQAPLSDVSVGSYFTKAKHFELYVNQFYETLGGLGHFSAGIFVEDIGSDNQIGLLPEPHLDGETIIPSTDPVWETNFQTLRKINIMLSDGVNNLPSAEYNNAKPFIAEGRFFRAWLYFGLLKKYGNVPWFDKVVNPGDEKALLTPRTSRDILVKNIVKDLDFAIENLNSIKKSDGRLSKEAALAFKSRVCLYEGTWEKYHKIENDQFQVVGSDGNEFLKEAAEAALNVINSGIFSLYNETDEPYFNLFNREDYSTNPEIILYRHYERAQGMKQSVSKVIYDSKDEKKGNFGMTNELVNSYLDIEGNPVSVSRLPLSDKNITELLVNRDPRLKQTLYFPGTMVYSNSVLNVTLYYPFLPYLKYCPTGYHSRKGASQDGANFNLKECQTDLIYIRYAEVLLNYIEAKAELGEVTQNDIDISINALRQRAGFSSGGNLNLANVPVDHENDFIKSGIAPLIVEIRRERRIELALEGFRIDDIKRWASADELLVDKTFFGAKYQWWVDNDTEGLYKPGKYATNSEGYLDPWGGRNLGFKIERDYLFPIATQEISLAEYQQNPGWE
jgi:hypothetical protein